ncbi:ABC transporter substrate-binding protein [Listeria cornellensis FSL F6-0969]|uniref:ABC transporter substrate-binding protein n=1 Tax=Listeria cornellensis FSL F6-0969 TaxID=1265820 RepID=W7C851_9LIST|nr:ABC transporter substrate-binding protein [Listeria cornellensis]EUJ31861.1 ABC transporter substrate-binding protein [Listeria cornellensis FSL F6-0969]
MKPDLVLGHASMMSYNKDAYDQIKKANIPLFVVEDAQTFDAAYKTFTQIGDLTGTTKEAEKLVSSMQATDKMIRKEATQKVQTKAKVWLEISQIYTQPAKTRSSTKCLPTSKLQTSSRKKATRNTAKSKLSKPRPT